MCAGKICMATNICVRLRAGIATDSAAATQAIATELAQVIPANTVVALHGDMGVGKTTFVQGLARGFGITQQVTSPTFAIYSVYLGTLRNLVHVDAYRIENAPQLDALLIEEFLQPPWCLVVEWPEKTGAWLPANAWHLTLSIVPGERHHLQLTAGDA